MKPSKGMSSVTTETKPFRPLATMEKWLDTAMRSDHHDVTNISEECGIDRGAWYDWLKKPGFIDWYTATWNDRLRAVGPRLDMIGLINSKRDYRYWEAMQKRVGNLQDASTNVAVQVNVPSVVDANGQTLNL